MIDTSAQPAPPLVSVLVPCFNNERHVGEAVESALAQTHPRVEVIVVDDGSSDRSVNVLRGFGDRIRWETGPNRGACAARNRAFALSSGEFVQYLDADDRLRPEKIERQLPPLLSDQADVVTCRGAIFGDGKPLRPKKSRPPDPAGIDPFVYCLSHGLATEGPLIRRQLVERVGGFKHGLPRGQEREFHLRLAAAGGQLQMVDHLLYEHRNDARPGRITAQKPPAGYNARVMVELAMLVESDTRYTLDEARRQALTRTLLRNADHAHRGGDRAAAAAAYAIARQLAPAVRPEDLSRARGLAWGLLGPLLTADLWAAGRRIVRGPRRTFAAVHG